MKLFVANRGEIALRILRTARDMGISTAVGYCEADREAPFAALADEAYLLDGDPISAYTDAEQIIATALRAHADAIHPGYGFLSESAEFAQAVQENSLLWIGPSPQALETLGDKLSARTLAHGIGVAPVPGLSQGSFSRDDLRSFIESHDFPVVVKKADGGGGHGIQVLRTDADCERFFTAHSHHVSGYVAEKYVEHARHVETQCARDSHGNFAVISTRDCSIQRRNQKLIEEAPAPHLDSAVHDHLVQWSQRLFEAVDYQGLGTCEFLYTGSDLYFLEVNPRLQVEHTVSEEVTGMDLVREQIRIACAQALSPVPPTHGHSIELRITSEDPRNNMTPTAGVISKLRWPLGHGIRIESGVEEGSAVSTNFDSMLAKIIVSAPDRATALERCTRALEEFSLTGVSTPADLYKDIVAHPDFANMNITTRWLESVFLPAWADSATASGDQAIPASPAVQESAENRTFVIEIDGKRANLTLPEAMLRQEGESSAPPIRAGEARPSEGVQPLRHSRKNSCTPGAVSASDSDTVTSPIQALVLNVCVDEGAHVSEGDLLIVLESMKMENYVCAPRDGVVQSIAISKGATVNPGDMLLRFAPQANAQASAPQAPSESEE